MIKDKSKAKGNYLFNAMVAVPKKLTMAEAIDFMDKEINKVRHDMLDELAKKHGVKLQYAN